VRSEKRKSRRPAEAEKRGRVRAELRFQRKNRIVRAAPLE